MGADANERIRTCHWHPENHFCPHGKPKIDSEHDSPVAMPEVARKKMPSESTGCVCVVVVVEIITLYPVQTGRI